MSLDVLHVVSHFPPDSYGGVETHVRDLVTHLDSSSDINPSILTTTSGDRPETDYPFDVTWTQRVTPIRKAPLAPSLIIELARQTPDVIHAHVPFHSAFAPAVLASQIKSVPLIATIHNHSLSGGLRHNIYMQLIKHPLLRKCDCIVGSTDEFLQEFKIFRSLDEKITVIPHGIDANRFRPASQSAVEDIRQQYGLPDEAPILLTVAALDEGHYYKHVEWLIDALHLIQDTHPKAHLLIGGTGERKSSLRERVRQKGLDDSVTFAGFIPAEDLPTVYTLADVFVLPSDATESFGIVLIEAMACNTPVVASDIPGPAQVARSCGGEIFPPGNLEKLAHSVNETIRSDNNMPRNCIVKNYSWENIIDDWADLYKAILHS